MSAGHTPGPWEARDGVLRHRHWLVDAPGRRFICQVDGPPDQEGEANARLIAAAPDLLTAAISARQVLAEENPSSEDWDRALLALVAAVAKAGCPA